MSSLTFSTASHLQPFVQFLISSSTSKTLSRSSSVTVSVTPTRFRRHQTNSPNPVKTIITAQWQNSLLPPDPPIPTLTTFYNNFPRLYSHVFLLALDSQRDKVYVTSHDLLENRAVRPTYAISSQSLPLPIPKNNSQSNLVTDLFAFLYATPTEQDNPFLLYNASLVTSIIPTSICRHLQINHIRANDIVFNLTNTSKSKQISNRIALILNIFSICKIRIAAAAILQSPTFSNVNSNAVSLNGVLYIEKCIATLYGEKVYSDPEGIIVDAHFAVVIANATETPCFIENDLFKSASVHISDMARVFASYGSCYVIEQSEKEKENCSINNEISSSCDEPEQSLSIGPVWQLTAEDILGLSDEQIRYALRKESVAVTNNESRSSLLGKFVQFMDEVQRRELMIILAANEQMFDIASNLQKGRSKRGKILNELKNAEKQAEKEQNWSQVTKLAADLKRLEQKTQDITVEPGSYDPDLDQDEWYKPCR